MADAGTQEPLKSATAYILYGGMKNKPGTLLLYPDRIVHVARSALAAGAGGVIGALIGNRVAKGRAAGRAAEGGKGVTEISLARVTAVTRAKQGLNSKILEIQAAGEQHRFGVKFDQWSEDIANAIRQVGLTVTPAGDGYTVS